MKTLAPTSAPSRSQSSTQSSTPTSAPSRTGPRGALRAVVLLLALAILPLALGGCCTDPVNGESYFCLGEMSNAEEGQLGESYMPNFIAQSGGVYPDPELGSYLGEIVIDRMALRSHRPDLPWEFTILNTSQINAFALPGGKVFVTRGLLSELQTEAQFAHLMGHEIGHVSHKHFSRGQGRAALFALLLGVVTEVEGAIDEGDGFPIASTAVGVAGQLTLMKFSRSQELQSDVRGVDYAILAGYDPREGRKTFETFLEIKRRGGREENFIDDLLSTHPLDSRRIEELDEYITTTYPAIAGMGLDIDGPRWRPLLARVQDAQRTYDDHDAALALISRYGEESDPALLSQAAQKLERGAAALPGHAPFPLALAVVRQEQGRSDDAMSLLDRAVSLDPDLYGARFTRGSLLSRVGRAAEAREELRAAHELYPLSAQPTVLLGRVSETLGDSEAAIRWYRATLERSQPGGALESEAKARLAVLQAEVARG